ncbi:MAG: TolC family protein [Desulfobulbaceae bacterium]|nr:MAG: TolC family protein [Desulfobulbaceae bacterium]
MRKITWKMALAGGVSLALLAGCALKEPPSSEEVRQEALSGVELPSAWKAGGPAGEMKDNWLSGFSDPQLNALVDEALQHNPDLRVSAARVEQAGEYVNQAKAALLPAITLFGTGGVKSGGGDLSSAIQGAALPISWEIDLWGRLRYGRNAAEQTSLAAQADFEYARQSLAAAVARSWFTASETWLQGQIATEMVQSSEQLLALAEIRYKVGVGSEQDVALAQASLGSLRDGAKQIELAHQQALRALELLVGRYPSAELAIRHDLTTLPRPVPVGMPLAMLERRPDLVAAERRVAAAFNRVGEARAARLPKITLNASVAAMTSEIIEMKEDFDNPTSGAGARLIAPVYQGGALVSQVEIRTLEQKEAVAAYAASALKALGDVENALAAGGNLAEREELLQRAVADNRRALDLVQTSYRTGKADMRAVQSQLLDLQAARLSLLRVQSEQLSQRVNLHLALGGGFDQAS